MRYIKACCYWLKSLGIHCLHYAQCLFLFKTNSKIKHVPNYSHRYKAEERKTSLKKIQNNSTMYFIHRSLPFVPSRNARDKKRLGGWQQFTLSFFNLTTVKIMWYPKLRYNILFTHNKDRFKRKVSESIFDLVNCHGIVHLFVPGVITFLLHEINANNYFTWTGKP